MLAFFPGAARPLPAVLHPARSQELKGAPCPGEDGSPRTATMETRAERVCSLSRGEPLGCPHCPVAGEPLQESNGTQRFWGWRAYSERWPRERVAFQSSDAAALRPAGRGGERMTQGPGGAGGGGVRPRPSSGRSPRRRPWAATPATTESRHGPNVPKCADLGGILRNLFPNFWNGNAPLYLAEQKTGPPWLLETREHTTLNTEKGGMFVVLRKTISP